MGTITATVDDDVERNFRRTVSEKLGSGKGKIGKAITEAMKKWILSVEQQKAKGLLAVIDEKEGKTATAQPDS